jgi:glucose/mannose-6-phosphate isomerase
MAPPDTMRAQALALGDQLRSAAPLARGALDGAGPFRNICLCGLGGSAAGARLATALLAEDLALPVDIPVGVGLPGWVGPETLVVVTSYSGETLEALDWFAEAGVRGATRAVVGSGGTLAALAAEAGAPAIVVEGGWQPRGALGLLLAPLLVLLREAGAAPDPEELIAFGADAADAAGLRDDEAREVATRLAGSVTVLYGSGMRAAVAVRLKNQLNENAKVAAFFGELPEAHHNEVVGWHHTDAPLTAIVLEAPGEHDRMEARFDLTAEILGSAGIPAERVRSRGESATARVMTLVLLGDLVSVYLGVLQGHDPTPVTHLEDLKKRLA